MDNRHLRCWAEIDLAQIKKNLDIYKKHIPRNEDIIAVVKADAYGHGDRVVSKYLSDNGVSFFAVSNIDEGIHIREAGVKGKILILGYTPVARVKDLLHYNISQTILSEEYADSITNSGYPVKCQFAIDTGMRRIGINADNPDECEKTIREYAKKIKIEGLFTHLCVADIEDQKEFTQHQIDQFEEICRRLSDLKLPFCHCMNSAGGLWYRSKYSHCTRLGIILYGLKPDYTSVLPPNIEPVLSWKSVISMVKEVHLGDTIGYGRTFKTDHTLTVATIPTGYADGYPRLLSNKGWVLINGCKAPIVGQICMDQMMVDVTYIPDVHLGTEVVLIGKSENEIIRADDLAHIIGTIGYEIVCGISKRVQRIYPVV